jgi:hypothetical protein
MVGTKQEMEGFVSLFKRDNKRELPPLWSEAELEQMSVNYESVMDFLLGLSDKDYDTVFKVANIHRQANKDASAVRGKAYEPTTFIDSPLNELQTIDPVIIDKTILEDDELNNAFLEDDQDTTASRQQRRTAKKAVKNGK